MFLVLGLALIWPMVAGAASPEIAPPLTVADQYMLAIPQAGFGKDYLFTASLIPQQQAATM